MSCGLRSWRGTAWNRVRGGREEEQGKQPLPSGGPWAAVLVDPAAGGGDDERVAILSFEVRPIASWNSVLEDQAELGVPRGAALSLIED